MFNAFRLATGAVLALATISAPVAARDYRGYGYNSARGYHGGYGYRGYHGYRHGGGIGIGGALLGAAIIGGIAVAASSANRDRYDTRYGYSGSVAPPQGYGYDEGYAPGGYADDERGATYRGDDRRAGPDPVDACARAVEREVSRGGDRGRVSTIDSVAAYDGGNTVRGQVEIDRDGRGDAVAFSCNANYQGRTSLRIG